MNPLSKERDVPTIPALHACTPADCQDCDARPHSVCAGVPDQGIRELEANVTHVTTPARGSILMEGDAAQHMFNVTSGTVRVYKLLPDGRRQVIGFLMTGDFLGFAVRDVYAYSAEAVTEVSLCRFSRPRMESLLQKFPGMEKRLLGMAANELAIAQDLMLLLGRKTARERLASFLLMLSDRLKRLGRATNPLPLPMSRSDIADYLGLTTETVSRAFTQFKNDGLIALEGADTVRLTDLDGLQDIAGGN